MTQLYVDVAGQLLWLQAVGRPSASFMISTAANGVGELENSGCTPRGHHEIAEKIGDGCAPNTVFRGRVPDGQTYSEQLRQQNPDSDWILTRILWLRGLEPGRNAGGDRDSYKRYIYIHGTPDSMPLGTPGSRGCIRMRNSDVVSLFDSVAVGDPVWIK